MTRRAWLIVGLMALAACASLPPRALAPPGVGFELLEPLLGVRAGPEGLTITVRSSGCTAKADFAFYLDRHDEFPTLAFGRKRVDACKGPAAPMELTFSYAELGLAPDARVFVVNPLAAR